MNEISASPLSVIDTPELLSRFSVRNHQAIPASVRDIADDAHINAVGIGTLGAEMVQILSRNMPEDITCHEVIFNPKLEASEEMAALISLVRESDLLFILTGFDDEYCGVAAQAIGHSAREAGVLTLAITPDEGGVPPQSLAELAKDVDTVFAISDGALADKHEPLLVQKDTLAGYTMRHMIVAITCLINQRSLIGIDFTDIKIIMRKGSAGRIGVGVASGPTTKGSSAAQLALAHLAAQGVSTFDAKGMLVIAQGSLLSMDAYNDVNKVIHEHAAENAKIIVGFVTDNQLGDNVRVSVMPVR